MKINYQPVLYRDASTDSAIIAGSAQLASSAINSMSVSGSSARDRDFMKEMHDKQRAEALADRDYANQYNLPSAEMARLKAAGLNPNLIYGKAGGDMASSPVRSSDFTPYHRQAPQIDLGGAVGSYFQIQSQQSQLANMAAQRHVMDAQADMYSANAEATRQQTPGYTAESGIKQINLNVAQATQQAKIDYENGKPAELNANIAKTLTTTTIDKLKALPSVELMVTEAAKNIADTEVLQSRKAEINQMVDNLKNTNTLQGLEIKNIKQTGMKIGTAGQMWTLASMILNKLFPAEGPSKPLPKDMNPSTGEPNKPYNELDSLLNK